MRKKVLISIIFIVLLTGCRNLPQDTVFQVSTIDALLSGVYDGTMSINELKKHGNFGIGTFQALDGEMILLDDTIYQVKADGKVYTPKNITTPFATVCFFHPDGSSALSPMSNFSDVEEKIDSEFPNKNLFYAIKIKGKFKYVKTRSVPGQTKPYPPLSEVTKNQPEFEMKNLFGTIVGFRCPEYVKGINVPGYHLHFISEDRTSGGHILDFTLLEGEYEIDTINHYVLSLPEDVDGFAKVDLTKDRGEELNRVEKD